MKRRIALVALAGLAFIGLEGCVTNATGHNSVDKGKVAKSHYYVQLSPKDGRDLASIIAKRMQARGLDAVAGPVQPKDIDYVVTYVDRWQWDMRMYLLSLRIELRDPKDQSIAGYGETMQTSLAAMGKSFDDIIDKALAELFMVR